MSWLWCQAASTTGIFIILSHDSKCNRIPVLSLHATTSLHLSLPADVVCFSILCIKFFFAKIFQRSFFFVIKKKLFVSKLKFLGVIDKFNGIQTFFFFSFRSLFFSSSVWNTNKRYERKYASCTMSRKKNITTIKNNKLKI